MAGKVVGVDVGGTNVKAALFDRKLRVIRKVSVPTGKDVYGTLSYVIGRLVSKDAAAIGVGFPGIVEKGRVVRSPNLAVKNLDLEKRLGKEFKLPVSVENDANCFALAEAFRRDSNIVVGITLGTGFGSGVVTNNQLSGNAELGHMTIVKDGARCSCGGQGHVESYVSSYGIMSRAGGIKAETVLELHNLAKKGNRKALRLFYETGRYLGVALRNIINAFSPDVIVIGGKIANSLPYMSKGVKEELGKGLVVGSPRIVKSAHKNAGSLGAAINALNKL